MTKAGSIGSISANSPKISDDFGGESLALDKEPADISDEEKTKHGEGGSPSPKVDANGNFSSADTVSLSKDSKDSKSSKTTAMGRDKGKFENKTVSKINDVRDRQRELKADIDMHGQNKNPLIQNTGRGVIT